jgi:hypothetical protein
VEESLIKKLIATIKCGACGQNYGEDNIEIIEHSEEMWFLRVFCPSCRVKCLVAAIIREGEKSEVITDLTESELGRFKGLDGITEEDLLEMHNFLKDFDGDFPRLFRQA